MHEVMYDGPPNVHQFEIERISSEIDANTLNTRRVKFLYIIRMKRNWMNQVINAIFPTWLLFLLAYSTIFIRLDNFNNRFMGSVTSLLVLASLLGAINSGLPKTSYFKYIDLWFLWHITIIFLIIIHHVIVDNIASNKHRSTVNAMDPNDEKLLIEGKTKQIFFNKIATLIFPFINMIFNIIYFYNSRESYL